MRTRTHTHTQAHLVDLLKRRAPLLHHRHAQRRRRDGADRKRRHRPRVHLLRHPIVHQHRKRAPLVVGQRRRAGEQVAARELEADHLGEADGAADGDGIGGPGGLEAAAGADLDDSLVNHVWGLGLGVGMGVRGSEGKRGRARVEGIGRAVDSTAHSNAKTTLKRYDQARRRSTANANAPTAPTGPHLGAVGGREHARRAQQLWLKGLPQQPRERVGLLRGQGARQLDVVADLPIDRGDLVAGLLLDLSVGGLGGWVGGMRG